MARVALVTGGTRGIGAAISKALQDAGRTVVASYAGNDAAAAAFTAGDRHRRDEIRRRRLRRLREGGRDDRRRVRPDRDPGQQCRHHARRHDVAHDPRHVGRGDRYQPRLLLQPVQADLRRHAQGEEIRPRRQYRQHQRPGRAIRPGELRRRQIRHPRLHQGAGAGRRALRHHGERDRARLCRYRHGARGAGGRAAEDHRPHPGRAAWAMPRTSPAAWCS